VKRFAKRTNWKKESNMQQMMFVWLKPSKGHQENVMQTR
jgi:hypothetical protein